MADGLQNIGNILAGFGAGVQGRGGQFLSGLEETRQAQAAEQKQLSDERRQAMLQDIAVGKDLLDRGRTEGAINLFRDRLQAIKELGADPTETQDTLNDLLAGNVDKVKANLTDVVKGAQIRGLLPDTPTSKFLKVVGNKALFQKPDGKLEVQDFSAAGVQPSEGKEVQSSKILAGGLTQVVFKDGTIETVRPEEADALDVRAAERRGAELQGIRAQERGLGSGAAKTALATFDRIAPIKQNISNLKEGIRLVREEGAETGPIADKLPSIRAGARKLDALRGRLGLDVVGAVTFGALSKGELDLAKDVALPKGLSEPELINWMEARINAQDKLADNLEEAALFLAKGGSIAGLIERNREQAEQLEEAPVTAPQAGVIRFDRQGNRIQ
jgi:hypothetical protein